MGAMLVSFEKALEVVSHTIEKYNRIRPHSSCDYLTPEKAHLQSGEMRKRWKQSIQHLEKVPVEIIK
jgi:hypothetical protein